jgi:hypothetical protein
MSDRLSQLRNHQIDDLITALDETLWCIDIEDRHADRHAHRAVETAIDLLTDYRDKRNNGADK